LHNHRNISVVGLADEQMEMLRHHHIADDGEFISLPYLFEDLEEQVSAGCRTEKRFPLVATTGDVMEIAATIPPAQSFWHGRNSILTSNYQIERFVTHPLRPQAACIFWLGPWTQRMGHPRYGGEIAKGERMGRLTKDFQLTGESICLMVRTE